MNLNQLEILHLLQETDCNLTKAAEKIRVVQSAVSRRLMMLEEEIGTPLFERHGQAFIRPNALVRAYFGGSRIRQPSEAQYPANRGR